MQLSIKIYTGNDAFSASPVHEVERIVCDLFKQAGYDLKQLDGAKMYDGNGNLVGDVSVTDAEPEPEPELKEEVEAEDIVHFSKDKWWFYDETWSHAYGPYETRADAQGALSNYCVAYLGLSIKTPS